MKNLTLLSLPALVTGVIMMTTSCKKGDAGPAGPAGPDSVQYSNWMAVNMSPIPPGDTIFYEQFTVKAITEDIINKGAVLGYYGFVDNQGDTTVENVSEVMEQLLYVGGIELDSYFYDPPQGAQGDIYRYVIIPGSVATSSFSGSPQTYTIDQLKKMSYKQVSQILNIPAKGSSLKVSSPN